MADLYRVYIDDSGNVDDKASNNPALRYGSVTGVILKAEYLDKTTGRTERQDGDLALTGETDRVYRSDHPVTVVDHLLDRRLRVTTEGAANRVVWNPWVEEAAKLDDVRDEWTSFVCVEGGNVLGNAVTVAPGESRSMTYRVEVLGR